MHVTRIIITYHIQESSFCANELQTVAIQANSMQVQQRVLSQKQREIRVATLNAEKGKPYLRQVQFQASNHSIFLPNKDPTQEEV
jgi:hypothetical protein